MNDKGEIAWDRMRDGSKKELRDFIVRPDVQKELALTPTEAAPAKPAFNIPPEWCDRIYDGVGKLEATLFSKFKGVPTDIAQQVFTYTAQEKAALREPTAKIINKYATEWMIKFQDEIALGFVLVSVTLAKVQACQMLMAARAAQTPAPPSAPSEPEAKAA